MGPPEKERPGDLAPLIREVRVGALPKRATGLVRPAELERIHGSKWCRCQQPFVEQFVDRPDTRRRRTQLGRRRWCNDGWYRWKEHHK